MFCGFAVAENEVVAPGNDQLYCVITGPLPTLLKLMQSSMQMEVSDAAITIVGGTLQSATSNVSITTSMPHKFSAVNEMLMGPGPRGCTPVGKSGPVYCIPSTSQV